MIQIICNKKWLRNYTWIRYNQLIKHTFSIDFDVAFSFDFLFFVFFQCFENIFFMNIFFLFSRIFFFFFWNKHQESTNDDPNTVNCLFSVLYDKQHQIPALCSHFKYIEVFVNIVFVNIVNTTHCHYLTYIFKWFFWFEWNILDENIEMKFSNGKSWGKSATKQFQMEKNVAKYSWWIFEMKNVRWKCLKWSKIGFFVWITWNLIKFVI